MKKTLGLALAIILIRIAPAPADTTIDPTNHYGWGANIGFTDWRPNTTDGVNIGTNFCAGYIYAANVGWIKMGTGAPANGTSYSNTSATDFGVNCSAGAAGGENHCGLASWAHICWSNFVSTVGPLVVVSTREPRAVGWSATIRGT